MIFQVTCHDYPFKKGEDTRETEVTAVSMRKNDWRNSVKRHKELHMKTSQFVRKFLLQASNIMLHEHQSYYGQILWAV